LATDTISSALCGVMEQALIEKGVDAALAKALAERACVPGLQAVPVVSKKVVRKASAYALKYGRAFKKVAKQYKTKSGSWKKNGFRNAQKAAHKLAKK
jgi:hypothetical protein